MTVSRVAASLRRSAEEAWRKHKQACLACAKGVPCTVGANLAGHAEQMRRQEELLKSPPDPDYAQDTLW